MHYDKLFRKAIYAIIDEQSVYKCLKFAEHLRFNIQVTDDTICQPVHIIRFFLVEFYHIRPIP